MSQLNEFDLLFSELKQATVQNPNANRASLVAIKSAPNKKLSNKRFIPTLIVLPIISIALVLFILSNSKQPEQQVFAFDNLEITQSILAPTNSMSTFKAKLPLQMNVFLIEDHIWERTLEDMLEGVVKVDKIPTTFPIFDLSITTEKKETFNFKVWDENNSLILMNIETKEVYASNTIDAANVLGMMLSTSSIKPSLQ